MTDFKQIIALRNSGKTQQEIANLLGISRRSVIRYLKEGHTPQYKRFTESNRKDPLEGFYDLIKEKLSLSTKLPLNELYEYLIIKGYEGSERTLRRKTLDLRKKLKLKEVYFQRKVMPGETMEGDFTEFYIPIAGTQRKVYLWVLSLPYSNSYFVTPYYHCSFESFADGSVNAFNEFGGVAAKYRLDNLSPAVSKILSGKNRIVTSRYAEFQKHYGFKQDFCNPGKGNEKGNVEANNKYIKNKILSQISLNKLSFKDLESFKKFVWKLSRDHNSRSDVKNKFKDENLISLPQTSFKCFRTEVVSINKYSLFTLDKNGHMYSVPSENIGLSLEARIYPDKIEVVKNGEIKCQHRRIYGKRGLVSIMPEHIIDGLLKKPGAMNDWKYRHILFERPAWINFYKKLKSRGGSDKEYLKCLKLMTEHGREIVTVAMELSVDSNEEFSASHLSRIITNEMENILELSPLKVDLNQYDAFLKGENNASKS